MLHSSPYLAMLLPRSNEALVPLLMVAICLFQPHPCGSILNHILVSVSLDLLIGAIVLVEDIGSHLTSAINSILHEPPRERRHEDNAEQGRVKDG